MTMKDMALRICRCEEKLENARKTLQQVKQFVSDDYEKARIQDAINKGLLGDLNALINDINEIKTDIREFQKYLETKQKPSQ